MPRPRALLLPLVCMAVLTAGCSGGDEPDDDPRAYADAVAQWREGELDPAVAAVRAATFSDLVVIGRPETPQERAGQDVRCQQVRDARAAVSALAPPAPQDGSGADDLGVRSAAYRDAVVPALDRVVSYCTWYAATLDVGARRRAVERTITALGDKQGVDPRTGVRCASAIGCVPSDPAKLPAYVRAYGSGVDLLGEGLDVFGGTSVPCPLPDLEPVCAIYAREKPRSVAIRRAAYEAFATAQRTGTSTVDNAAISRASAADNAERDRVRALVDRAYAAAAPEAFRRGRGSTTRVEVALLQEYERTAAAAPVP